MTFGVVAFPHQQEPTGDLNMIQETWTGGCQCGAVRYRLLRRPNNPCLYHCRMCQKRFGNFFGAFAGVSAEHFVLSRGTIAHFRSSSEAERGFCRDCGTPLVYRFLSQPRIDVSIGSLDRHSEMKPEFQYGLESREPWLTEILSLPGTVTGEGDNDVGDTPERFVQIPKSNRQHPDHDTAD
jgi:hypothetical protein